MRNKFYKILDRFFVVLGALIFAQFPLFYQEYVQRLSGHIEELKYQVQLMRETATQSGKALEEFIHKFISNTDLDISRQGELMQAMVHRLEGLSDSLVLFKQHSLLLRPFTFLLHSDTQITKATLYHFSPGIPLTIEGICYAIFGMFFGYFTFKLIEKLLLAIRNRGEISSPRPN